MAEKYAAIDPSIRALSEHATIGPKERIAVVRRLREALAQLEPQYAAFEWWEERHDQRCFCFVPYNDANRASLERLAQIMRDHARPDHRCVATTVELPEWVVARDSRDAGFDRQRVPCRCATSDQDYRRHVGALYLEPPDLWPEYVVLTMLDHDLVHLRSKRCVINEHVVTPDRIDALIAAVSCPRALLHANAGGLLPALLLHNGWQFHAVRDLAEHQRSVARWDPLRDPMTASLVSSVHRLPGDTDPWFRSPFAPTWWRESSDADIERGLFWRTLVHDGYPEDLIPMPGEQSDTESSDPTSLNSSDNEATNGE